MIKSAIFIAKQLHESSIGEELYKIGVYTAFMKSMGVSYDFAGAILHEDREIVIFAGKPKRISIEDENVTEIVEVETTDNYIGMIQTIKQYELVHFEEKYFSVSGIDYYTLGALKSIYEQYNIKSIA